MGPACTSRPAPGNRHWGALNCSLAWTCSASGRLSMHPSGRGGWQAELPCPTNGQRLHHLSAHSAPRVQPHAPRDAVHGAAEQSNRCLLLWVPVLGGKPRLLLCLGLLALSGDAAAIVACDCSLRLGACSLGGMRNVAWVAVAPKSNPSSPVLQMYTGLHAWGGRRVAQIVHAKTVLHQCLELPPHCPPLFRVSTPLLAARPPCPALPSHALPCSHLQVACLAPRPPCQSLVESCLDSDHTQRPSFDDILAALQPLIREVTPGVLL